MGITRAEALAALANQDHINHVLVDQYVLTRGGGWHEFADELNGILRDVDIFNDLSAQFPGLSPNTRPENLPLPVLEEVINIWREQNGQE